MKLLIINPGSTSTKLALYDGAEKLVQESLDHDAAELQQYHTIAEQVPMRLSVIRSFMERNGIDEKELAAVIGRGGGPQIGKTKLSGRLFGGEQTG